MTSNPTHIPCRLRHETAASGNCSSTSGAEAIDLLDRTLEQVQDAGKILRRVIDLTKSEAVRQAWAWFELARVLKWQRAPLSEVKAACEEAMRLHPAERRFGDWLAHL